MVAYLEKLEKSFVPEGGVKERMHAARTGYRQGQDAYLKELETRVALLEEENRQLKAQLQEAQGSPRKS